MLSNTEPIKTIEMHRLVRPYTKKKSLKAILILATDIALFCLLFYFVITVKIVWIKAILSIFLGFSISFLFAVGHDCCHNSFTKNRFFNKFMGVLVFLPALHNYSLWDLAHNRRHHAYTNYSKIDNVYTPISVKEFENLNYFERIMYKIYRSSIGHGLYYGIELWFKKMFIPNKSIPDIEKEKISTHWLSVIPVMLYLATIMSIIFFVSKNTNQIFILNFIFAFVIPFFTWNWLMGFVIFHHHTNPYTNWYNDIDEWNYWEAQIEHTPHVKFPKPMNFLFHNIMEHTAHHSNQQIPMYNLVQAQNNMENHFKERIKTVDWNFKFYLDSISKCKLYDYKNHKWLSFKEIKTA